MAAGLVALATLVRAESAIAQAPPNDDFPGIELALHPAPFTVDTRGATAEPSEPFGANQVTSVWYTYTTPSDGGLRVSIDDATAPAFVNIYRGSTLGSLVEVASGGTSFRPTLLVEAGERLAIQVGAVFGAPEGGTLTLTIQTGPPPPNDQFPGLPITELPFYDVVDTAFATVDAGEPSLLAGTVWYSFTAPEAMTLAADTWGSGFRAGLALVTADTLTIPGGSDRGTAELCDQGVASRVFTVAAGEQVWFQVGGRGAQPAERGRLVFNVTRLFDGVTHNPRCRVSDATHPIPVHFGPLPGPAAHAFPDLSGATQLTGEAIITARIPRAGRLSPAEGGSIVSATADLAPSGSFYAQFLYSMPGGRQVTVQSWTKTGEIVLVAPSGSPVTEVQQTYISGVPAVTFLGTTNVVGPSPRAVWFLLDGIVYSLGFDGYSDNSEVLAIAERTIAFLQVRPPAVGSGHTEHGGGDGASAIILAMAVGLIAASAGAWRRGAARGR